MSTSGEEIAENTLGWRAGGGGINRGNAGGKLTKLSGDFDSILSGLEEFNTTDGLPSDDKEFLEEFSFVELRILPLKSFRLLLKVLTWGNAPALFPVDPPGE